MKIAELKEELQNRRTKSEIIRKNIDQYCQENYGIINFSSLADKHFSTVSDPEATSLIIDNSLTCLNVESLAINVLTDWANRFLSLNCVAWEFSRDRITDLNRKKLSAIKTPIILGKAGNTFITETEETLYVRERMKRLNGRIINTLYSKKHNTMLPEYHHEQYKKVLGEEKILDRSPLVKEWLSQNFKNNGKIQPEKIFIKTKRNYESLAVPQKGYFLNGYDPRPPLEWYYLLNLLLFVDGQRVLLINKSKNNKLYQLFKENSSLIKEICGGFEPLILGIPDQIRINDSVFNLTEIPLWVLEKNNCWRVRINRSLLSPEENWYDLMAKIEREIIQLSLTE
ncbi:MAG: hypothetical protein MUF50_05095 [Planctomycetes bacterium]|nr:hypothetical protein [Planctomycetota bacterium]